MHGPRSWLRARTAALAMVLCQTLAAQSLPLPADSGLRIDGLVELRAGWSTRDGESVLDAQRLQLDASWRSSAWSLTARAHSQRTRGLDVQAAEEGRMDALHVDRDFGACRLRIGLQTVVWGQADTLRVLDVVNPLDRREAYFGEWETKRLPLAMLNAECLVGEESFQWLWIPQPRFDRLPSAQGRFAAPDATQWLHDSSIPVTPAGLPSATRLGDGSLGLQWAGRANRIDYTLNALHGWEPVLRADAVPGAGYLARPHRALMLGGSFSAALADVVVRGEYAAQRHVTDYVMADAGLPSATEVNRRSWLVAADRASGPWWLSMQVFDSQSDGAGSVLTPARQSMLTLAVRRSLLRDRLSVGARLGFDTVRHARYWLMDARYEISEQWLAKLSVEQFGGAEDSFGYWRAQNRAWVTLRHAF